MTGAAPDIEMSLFTEVSALVSTGSGRFEAELHPEWTIAGKPNGGYLLAILGRAAATVGPHPYPITASAHYLSAPSPGPVSVEAEALRIGRSASQVRARMSQDGRACVEALVTTGHLDAASLSYWDRGVPPRGDVPYDQCARLVPRLPDGSKVAIMEQVEVRLEPASEGFTKGEPSGRGELRGWLALPAGHAFDPTSLLFAVDAFPPATFDLEFSGWVPTLELTAYVRAQPQPGPLRVLQQARMIADHRVDEACFIWDNSGRLVAQATQLAAVRLG